MLNEEEIIQRLQDKKKQRAAFTEIVIHFSEPLYWQIRKMVLSHDDANDLLQNTFMKSWMNIDSFRGESKLSTWLYRIAVNETITFLNRQKLKNQVSITGDKVDKSLLDVLEADRYFSGDDVQLNLQRAILTLPDKQRMVFNMKYFDDMKYEEISEITGTSVGALKASYHHAVKKIEDYLASDVMHGEN
ncbi:MAG: RNA polymerase sigma factor [Bacteroidales bacterium]|jgi:RNA polymerase sigma-70 factor (ECF subfamily)|nr:RNA polymerase sigma factor [Bacteroidales bacterium]